MESLEGLLWRVTRTHNVLEPSDAIHAKSLAMAGGGLADWKLMLSLGELNN